jgi:hypothetical protein
MNPFEINDVDPAIPQFAIIPSGTNNKFIIQQASSGRRVGLSFATPMPLSAPLKETQNENASGWSIARLLTTFVILLIVAFCGWIYYTNEINEIQKDIVFCRNNADTQDKRIKAMYFDTCPKYEEYMDSPAWYIFVCLKLLRILSFFDNIGFYMSENLGMVGLFLIGVALFMNMISEQLSKILSPFIQKRKRE